MRLLPNMLLFFKKALDKIKASVSTLAWIFSGSRQFGQAVLMFKLLMVRYPKFRFFKKFQGLVSQPHFVSDFSKKIFLRLYYINWRNIIAWLPLLLQMLGNMCIAIICDGINFEASISFLIKPFFSVNKKIELKFKYVKNKKSF